MDFLRKVEFMGLSPQRLKGLALLLPALSMGCTYPMGGPVPRGAAQPMMMPTTGYAPSAQGGPVAFGPAPVTTTFAPTMLPQTASSGTTFFNVRPGDSLSSVATLYGVSEHDLRKTNNLGPNDKLNPGQLVKIPDGATAIR